MYSYETIQITFNATGSRRFRGLYLIYFVVQFRLIYLLTFRFYDHGL